MVNATKYQDKGIWYKTSHIKTNKEVRILVKELETGKSVKAIRFDKLTGKIKKPTEW